MEKSRTLTLTDGRQITIRRLNMGERLDVEEKSIVGNDVNDRKHMAILVEACTSPTIPESEFFKLDQDDGFALFWTSLDINDTLVNKNDFLSQSKAQAKTSGLTEPSPSISNT